MADLNKSLRGLAAKCIEEGHEVTGKTAAEILDYMANHWAGGGGGGEKEIVYVDIIKSEEEAEEPFIAKVGDNEVNASALYAIAAQGKRLIGRIAGTDSFGLNWISYSHCHNCTSEKVEFVDSASYEVRYVSYIVTDEQNEIEEFAPEQSGGVPVVHIVEDESAPKGYALDGWTYLDLIDVLSNGGYVVLFDGQRVYNPSKVGSSNLQFNCTAIVDSNVVTYAAFVDDEDVVELTQK